MSTYTAQHKAYYEANREKIIAWRKQYEPEWIKTPKGQYSVQKRKADQRKVPWEFTFDSWLELWQTSGKWEERGDSMGKYCMARKDDLGPYSPDNVEIKLFEDNSKEVWINKLRQTLLQELGMT